MASYPIATAKQLPMVLAEFGKAVREAEKAARRGGETECGKLREEHRILTLNWAKATDDDAGCAEAGNRAVGARDPWSWSPAHCPSVSDSNGYTRQKRRGTPNESASEN